MLTIIEMENLLVKRLNTTRFQHSLNVRDTAVMLARIYGADEKKAALAGLVHDCAKDMNLMELVKIVKDNEYYIDEVSAESTALLHGAAGAVLAHKEFGITDLEVLNAVRFHTTGRPNMTLLEKIIYIADYIEPQRNFKGVEELREVAIRSLDEALLKSFNNTIIYVISRGELLHKDTIEARNYLIKERQ